MSYAKLINGYPSYAPNPILVDGNWIGNPPGSVYEAEGYKPVIFTNAPEVEPGYEAVHGWYDDGDTIREVWTVVEKTDFDDAEAMEFLFGGDTE